MIRISYKIWLAVQNGVMLTKLKGGGSKSNMTSMLNVESIQTLSYIDALCLILLM